MTWDERIFDIQHSSFDILRFVTMTLVVSSHNLHPASCILQPATSILQPASSILHPATGAAEAETHRLHRLLIVTIKQREGNMVFNPSADYVFRVQDTLVVMGRLEDIRRFQEEYSI